MFIPFRDNSLTGFIVNVFAQGHFEYLGSLKRPSDIQTNKSLFKKGKELLFGKGEEERIIRPYAIVSDGKGRIYVVDNEQAVVHLFDTNKKKYSQIYKVTGGNLISPICAALDFRGNFYISDNFWRKIFVFNRKGKFVKEISDEGLSEEGKLANPVGVAVSPNNYLYVVDMNEHRIWVYDLGGAHRRPGYLFTFGIRGTRDGEFNYPSNIFVDNKGLVYVTDTMNFRIQIFDQNGKFIRKFGQIGDGPGYFSRPKGIALDSKGNFFVIDALRETIEVYDNNGQYLGFLGGRGKNPGQFSLPAGIHIDSGDTIYVADSFNQRIQIFRFHP